MNDLRSAYREFLCRRRWPLEIALCLLNGVYFVKTKIVEPPLSENLSKRQLANLKKRLKHDFGERLTTDSTEILLGEYVSEKWSFFWANDLTEIPLPELDEELADDSPLHDIWAKCRELSDYVKNYADLSYCELPYQTENGLEIKTSPVSEWNKEYLLDLGEQKGIDLKWLRSEIESSLRQLSGTNKSKSSIRQTVHTVTGYFGELEKWLATDPPKKTAKAFILHISRSSEIQKSAGVVDICSKNRFIKYENANGEIKIADLNAIGKAIRYRLP